jgi:hypothetical protein
MEIALIKTKPRNKPSHQVFNNNQQQEENRGTETAEKAKTKIGTHLTIIGVCTTTRPEKSGT